MMVLNSAQQLSALGVTARPSQASTKLLLRTITDPVTYSAAAAMDHLQLDRLDR
jgi:hypothetical protein